MNCADINKIENPQTKRCITINGAQHKKLIAQGIMPPYVAPKKCKDNEIINPKTNRCITIGTYLYKKLVKEGVIVPGAPVPQIVHKDKPSKRQCKNTSTFMMFDDVQNIPESDFFKTPDGYCFSAEEIIAYIDSDLFNNKNPHENTIEMFKENEIDTLLKNKPKLLEKLKTYFSKAKKQQDKNIDIFEKSIDVFYSVANTGRVCYFNNLTSFEKNDSSTFDRSIEYLQDLAEKISKLPPHHKTAYSRVVSYIEKANDGSWCIHGVGKMLIDFFLENFQKMNVAYDSNKTGLYFAKHAGEVVFYSYEHRHFTKWKRKNVEMYKTLQSIDKKMMTDRTARSETFKNKCDYEPYLVTLNSVDEWSELADWRKIMFNENMCFDILYLVKVITDNLNTAKNNNPYPKFPTNPFTQKDFTVNELKMLKNLLNDNFIKINPPLKLFLSNSDFWTNSRSWQNDFTTQLEKSMRFVRKNNMIGEELHCIGIWNVKTTPFSATERLIVRYLNSSDASYLRRLKNTPGETVADSYYFQVLDKYLQNVVMENT